MLKGQDIVVLCKLIIGRDDSPAVGKLAIALELSPSECHAAFKRLSAAGVLRVSTGESRAHKKIPVRRACEELLIHGVKYFFPAKIGQPTRGMATCLDATGLNSEMASVAGQICVWPWAEGKERGVSLEPLYKSVPVAANNDRELYHLLALIDALRAGRARERKIAVEQIRAIVQGARVK